jgi:chemotaxis protein CheX
MTRKDFELIDPIIESTKEVFETMVDLEINVTEKESVKIAGISSYTSLIGMNGIHKIGDQEISFRGNLSITWPESVFVKIANLMLGEEYTSFSNEIADTGNEIANMVMGNAKKLLAAQGYIIGMASPTLIKGGEYELIRKGVERFQRVNFESKIGSFHLEISYSDKGI